MRKLAFNLGMGCVEGVLAIDVIGFARDGNVGLASVHLAAFVFLVVVSTVCAVEDYRCG